MTTASALTSKIIPVTAVSSVEREEMWNLYRRFYSGTQRSLFEESFEKANAREAERENVSLFLKRNASYRNGDELNFFLINGMHRTEVATRDHFPLGDPGWNGQLLTVS